MPCVFTTIGNRNFLDKSSKLKQLLLNSSGFIKVTFKNNIQCNLGNLIAELLQFCDPIKTLPESTHAIAKNFLCFKPLYVSNNLSSAASSIGTSELGVSLPDFFNQEMVQIDSLKLSLHIERQRCVSINSAEGAHLIPTVHNLLLELILANDFNGITLGKD